MDATDPTIDPSAKGLFDVLQDAVIVTDTFGRIIYLNDAAERSFGYCADEALGQSLSIIMPTEHHCAFARGLDRHNRTGVPKMAGTTFSLNGRRRNGQEFPVQVSLARWFVGSTPLFCGLIQDLSDLCATPAEANRINRLRLYQNHTTEAQCSQSRKALRTPLAHLLQSLSSADEELRQPFADHPALAQRWASARQDAEEMEGVLEAVEELQQVGQGHLDGHLDLSQALHNALALLREPLHASDARIHTSTLPQSCYGLADMCLVWTHLLKNVLDHRHPQRTPMATISAQVVDGFCELRCQDNGIGMDAEQCTHATELFYRGHHGRAGQRGVGLSLVRRVCESLGGSVSLSSAPGAGTTVSLLLPEYQDCSQCHISNCAHRLYEPAVPDSEPIGNQHAHS